MMTFKKIIFNNLLWAFALLIIFSFKGFSQLKKANEHFQHFEYSQAISEYLKVIKKESQNIEAIQNLAHCYRFMGDYEKSEVFYAKALELPNYDPRTPLLYGKMLKANNKVDKAKEIFVVYANKNPYSKKVENEVNACDKVKLWAEQTPKRFEVALAKDINSKLSDFSPTNYEDGLVFVSERNVDHIENSAYSLTGKPFLAVYEAKQTGEDTFRKPQLFPSSINNDFHNGPITFNGQFNEAFLTRVDALAKGKKHTNNPQLYHLVKDNEKWKKPVPYEHNNPEYALAHPALSGDGQMLFLVSNMPGGHGGKDIYLSKRNGDTWSKPENLGPLVNTEGDEMFPYFSANGTLYFTSDGHEGYGGMDIFSAKFIDGRWGTVKNLKEPINSPKDDFGIMLVNDTIGYISSNRPGGKGSDDIYRFKIIYDKEIHSSVTGIFLYSKLNPAADVYLKLVDENNVEVQRVKTNKFGEFFFENLKIDKDYMIVFDEVDVNLSEESTIFITNEKNDKVAVLIKSGRKFFKFRALAEEQYNMMPLLKEEDIAIAAFNIFAQIYDKLPGDLPAGMEVYILNDDGDVVYTTTVDEKGNFSLKGLPPDRNYTFKLKDDSMAAKIYIMDNNNEVIEVIEKNQKGKFSFDKLAYEKARVALIKAGDTGLKPIQLFGQIYDKLPGDVPKGMEVYILNDGGDVVFTTTVDEKGNFSLKNLPPDRNYTFQLKDDALAAKIYIMDSNNEVVEVIEKNKTGKFLFDKLAYDKARVALVKAGDTGLKPVQLFGQIYDKLPGDMPAGLSVYALNDAGEIIAATTIDEKGNFNFENLPGDKKYSFKVKDAGLDAQILVLNENKEVVATIKKDAKGNFNYEPLAALKTKMGASGDTSDVQMVNFVGRVYEKLPGDIAKGMEVFLIDDDGNIVATANIDEKGNFVFKELPTDKNYKVKLKDEKLEANILLLNEENEVVETIKKDKKGNFNFEPLVADKIIKLKTKEEAEAPPIKLSGQLYQTLPGDVSKGLEVYAVNDAGDIIAIATVDEKGNFVFEKLPPDKNISFRLKDMGSEAKIELLNENKEVVETIKPNKKGNFDYVELKGDKGQLASVNAKDERMVKLQLEEEKKKKEDEKKKEEVKKKEEEKKKKEEEKKKYDTASVLVVIHYNFDKAELADEALVSSSNELNKVVETLRNNPTMRADIKAHTDSKGSDEYNLQLSRRRTNAAISYLVSKGVKRERIIGKGMGEKYPIAPNENPDGSDNPDGRAKNRRAEIRLVAK